METNKEEEICKIIYNFTKKQILGIVYNPTYEKMRLARKSVIKPFEKLNEKEKEEFMKLSKEILK